MMENLTISELQAKMTDETLTAQTLTKLYLDRIAQLDKQGPMINAIIELNPDALAIAEALDTERETKGVRGPLHGIPILLKDNIDTGDKMTTTAGSLALAGSIAAQDSFVAQKLREAGAVLLGKTNLSEWANCRSTRSTSGWSSRGGQTKNPYALDRNPCGSSSGSGAAVATGFCTAAIGTETDGSIICPSSRNSLVGLKPTVGLVSRSGIIPIAHSQDTAGPMTRTVSDAALILGVLAGVDPRDEMTGDNQGKTLADYAQFLNTNGLQGARIGIARQFFGSHPGVDAVIEGCLETMQALGATLIDPISIETADQLRQTELEVLLYEFKADLNPYLVGLGEAATVHSLAEVIAFNEANQARVMPYFGQELMLMAEAKGPLTDEAYLSALQTNHRLSRDEGIDAVLREHQLDAIVAPSGGLPWLIDWINGDHNTGHCSTLAAVSGYPHLTMPAGYVHGLPVGLSLFSGAYQEPTLIKFAYALEQALQVWQPPQFLATADIT